MSITNSKPIRQTDGSYRYNGLTIRKFANGDWRIDRADIDQTNWREVISGSTLDSLHNSLDGSIANALRAVEWLDQNGVPTKPERLTAFESAQQTLRTALRSLHRFEGKWYDGVEYRPSWSGNEEDVTYESSLTAIRKQVDTQFANLATAMRVLSDMENADWSNADFIADNAYRHTCYEYSESIQRLRFYRKVWGNLDPAGIGDAIAEYLPVEELATA